MLVGSVGILLRLRVSIRMVLGFCFSLVGLVPLFCIDLYEVFSV